MQRRAIRRRLPPVMTAPAWGAGKIKWLLRDDFTDTLTAGNVNGTAATPGPGTRAVTDTDSKLSIGSGAMAFDAHSTPAWGDPGINWDIGIVRAYGALLTAKLN